MPNPLVATIASPIILGDFEISRPCITYISIFFVVLDS
jgi:hypothetical protein